MKKKCIGKTAFSWEWDHSHANLLEPPFNIMKGTGGKVFCAEPQPHPPLIFVQQARPH